MRGFVIDENLIEYDDNGELTLKSKIREEMVQKLASEWNEINRKIEMRSWASRDERMDESDYHAEMADSYADDLEYDAEKKNPNLTDPERKEIREKAIESYWENKNNKDREIYVRRDVIEELLSDLGARMMRPYEHWNEDEAYMEYAENRFDLERDFY